MFLGRQMQLKQFKRNAKKILGFERFLSKTRDMENNCLLIFSMLLVHEK